MAQNLELIINAYIEEHKQNLPVFILENFKETSNESAQAKIIKTLNTFKVKNSLNDGDIKCFKAFISGLGKGDIDSQIALCKLYENLISERLSLAKKDSEKYASLYTALSVLAGMALSILLI